MRSYLEIAREALRGDSVAPDASYSDLTCRAMRRIEQLCPAGALTWARLAHPDLTDKIDVELFGRLDNIWDGQAPLADFEAALRELVRVHAEVGKLFSKSARGAPWGISLAPAGPASANNML